MRRALAHTLLLGLTLFGCARVLELDVELEAPAEPNPFEGVATVRLDVDLGDRWVTLGQGRWDQGPLPFDGTLPADVRRVLVVGADDAGRPRAVGASGPLDLVRDPPEGALTLRFVRVGALSRLEGAGVARPEGQAVGLPGGGVLFLGGVDAAGCTPPDTEIERVRGVGPGPVVPGGRAGDFEVHPLPDGRLIVLGGQVRPGCGAPEPATTAVVLDPEAQTSRTVDLPGPLPPGAAIAVVDASRVLVAGGADGDRALAEVQALDPRTGELRRIGQLDAPRSGAAAAALGGGRVLLAGGTFAPGFLADDATVFVPQRGAALSGRIPIGAASTGAAARRTAAGGVALVGGAGPGGAPRNEARMIAVGDAAQVPLGDSSLVAGLDAPPGPASLVEASDGSLLVLPEAGDPHWVRLLPRGASALRAPDGASAGGWRGGPLADGTILLRNAAGARVLFSPGPAGVRGPAERLRLDPDGAATGVGLVPRRPEAWGLQTDGLVGRAIAPRPPGPVEWAVTPTARGDFTLQVELQLGGDGQAALLFGVADGGYDYITLVGSAAAGRSEDRRRARPVACPPVPTPALLDQGAHVVRLERRGEEVTLDVDQDGAPELECAFTGAAIGGVGVGVVSGRVLFRDLRLGDAAP